MSDEQPPDMEATAGGHATPTFVLTADPPVSFEVPTATVRENKAFLRTNAAQTSIIERINEIDARLREQETVTGKVLGICEKIEERFTRNDVQSKQIATIFDSLLKRVTGVETRVKTNEDDISENDELYNVLEAKVNANTKGTESASKKFHFMEAEARRKILIIEGYKEAEGQALRTIVDSLLSDLQLNFNSSAAESVYRRGRKQVPVQGQNYTPRPRPIVVVFSNQQYKQYVFQNVRFLGRIDQWINVSLSDDLTQDERLKQGELKAINALARSKNIRCAVKNLTITIEGRPYSYEQIDDLPYDLSLRNAKTQDTPDGIAYQSRHAPLSNLHQCDIPYGNHYYDSTERAYQHQMAQRCGDHELADKILEAVSPEDCMYLAKSLKKTRAIIEEEEDLMHAVNEVKYTHNPGLNELLLDTEGMIYEATFHPKWGCGFHLGQRREMVKENMTRPGHRNMMGDILMQIRADLLRIVEQESAANISTQSIPNSPDNQPNNALPAALHPVALVA